MKDTGLRRTWPNAITREGARGMEFSAWGQPGNPPGHEANLVFTRLLAGPMDYTPGIFGMQTRSPGGIQTTWAKQLALYVVVYSPLQMAADLLDNYEANPAPFQFIKDVPVDWETTRVLNGEVGDFVTPGTTLVEVHGAALPAGGKQLRGLFDAAREGGNQDQANRGA